MNAWQRLAALAAVTGILAGCAVTSLDESASRASRHVTERIASTPAWPPAPGTAPVPDGPLDLPGALALAFAHNPDILRLYARIGFAQADLQSAARLSNPRLSFAWLDPSGSGRDATTRGIAASFSELLLLPSRRRLSAVELERTELAVAGSLLALARDVEVAWHAAAGNALAAERRESAAEAAETAAALAERYREAGNLPQEALDEERMRAAERRVSALAAQARLAESRAQLARLTGLSSADAWRTGGELPAPPEDPLASEGLAARAAGQRFDLAALALEVRVLEVLRGSARHRRLLGDVEVGHERERETDGEKRDGATLALELPLFDQGQGTVAHAEAALLDARARHDGLALAIANDVTAGVARLELARAAAEQQRRIRLPAAMSAAARSQERVNYMLEGPLTLLHAQAARREAEADWLDAVRDYWIARAELRAAAGGALPGDGEPRPPAMPPEEEMPRDEGAHQHHGDEK